LIRNIFDSFKKEPLFRIKQNDSGELQNIVAQMQAEMWIPNQFARCEYLKILLSLFLIVVQRFEVRKDCNGLLMNKPSYILLFVKFRQVLEERYREIHTVSQYAGILNVSNGTLSNCTEEISH
jgi:hypothetical protein